MTNFVDRPMAAYGYQRTLHGLATTSTFGRKADVVLDTAHVAF